MSGSSTRYPWGDGPLERNDLLTAALVGELLGLRQCTVEDFVRAQVETRLAELLDRSA